MHESSSYVNIDVALQKNVIEIDISKWIFSNLIPPSSTLYCIVLYESDSTYFCIGRKQTEQQKDYLCKDDFVVRINGIYAAKMLLKFWNEYNELKQLAMK